MENDNYHCNNFDHDLTFAKYGMATPAVKRKAFLEDSDVANKKARIDLNTSETDDNGRSINTECSDTDTDNDNDSIKTADTPNTPFSPSRTAHPSDLKTWVCDFPGCTKKFNRPIRLVAHKRSHTNERPFICEYDGCDKAYTESKHLTQHVKGTHLQERPYVCDWPDCNKSFLTGTRLKRHKEAHEGHDRFRCTEFPPCNQTFRKHQTLDRHIRTDHKHLPAFSCSHTDTRINKQCTAGFDTAGALRKHEDRVHGSLRFFCDECKLPDGTSSLGFRTKTELTKHVKTTHLNCLFCELSFQSQEDLLEHTEDVHAEQSLPNKPQKKLVCTQDGCGKTFTKKYNLDVHIRTIHNGERFTCGVYNLSKSELVPGWDGSDACAREFTAKVNLEDHIRTQHLGLPSIVNARRTRTSAPKKRASKKDTTVSDVVAKLSGKAYEEDPKRLFPCTVPGCERRFMRKYDMEQHVRTFKHETPSSNNSLEDDLAAASSAAFASVFPDIQAPSHSNISHNSLTPGETFSIFESKYASNQEPENGSFDDYETISGNEPFWFGSDGSGNSVHIQAFSDEWRSDETEMRSLIDQNNQITSNEVFEQFIDPSLAALGSSH